MESLLRTQVSEFLLKDALKIGEIEQLVKECTKELPPEAWSRAHFPFVRSVDSVFTQYQKAVVPEQFAKVLYNGNRIEPEMIRSFEESMQQNRSEFMMKRITLLEFMNSSRRGETSNL